jgi:hypothetical protein
LPGKARAVGTNANSPLFARPASGPFGVVPSCRPGPRPLEAPPEEGIAQSADPRFSLGLVLPAQQVTLTGMPRAELQAHYRRIGKDGGALVQSAGPRGANPGRPMSAQAACEMPFGSQRNAHLRRFPRRISKLDAGRRPGGHPRARRCPQNQCSAGSSTSSLAREPGYW